MAVYTQISETQIHDYLQAFPLPPLSGFSGIAEGVSNTNYLLRFEGGLKLILTIFEERTPIADLPYYMALMEYLAAQDIPCPRPQRTHSGEALHAIAGRPAAMVSFLPGASALQPDAPHCAAMGAMLGQMHRAAESFSLKRKNSMGQEVWLDLLQRSHDGSAAQQEILHHCERVIVQWPHDLPMGAIHADMFPNNVFFDEKKLCGVKLCGVIDFYFACHDLLAYDLAIALNAWCARPDGSLCPERARSLLQAYQAQRPLTQAETAAMPLVLQGAALRFLSSRQYDLAHHPKDAVVTPLDPAEYVRILAFHRNYPLAFKDWLACATAA